MLWNKLDKLKSILWERPENATILWGVQQFVYKWPHHFTISIRFKKKKKKSVHTGDISNIQTDAECLAW